MNRIFGSDSAFETPSEGRTVLGALTGERASRSAAIESFAWDYPFKILAESFVASGKAPAVTALCLLGIVFTCGATLFVGLPPMTIYGHDIPGFLDGGWRVLQGQVPHVDFYSALGPIYYFLWAAGFKMAHYRVEGFVYATVLVGVALGLWSFAITRNRFGALCATFSSVFLVSFWLAPFAIGDPYSSTSYAMQYNRLGYVLLLIIFIELFGVPVEEGHAKGEWGGLSSGLALGLLLFLKANFFMVALVPVAYAYVFRIKGRRHGLLLLSGFLAVLLPMSGYLHWRLDSYLADLRIAGGARATQKGALIRAAIRIPSRNFTTIASLVGLSLLSLAIPGDENTKRSHYPSRSLMWLLLVLGCDFVLASSNMQSSGLPLSLMAVLLLIDQLLRRTKPEARQMQWALAGSLFVVVMLVTLPHITDLVSAWQAEGVVLIGRSSRGSHIDAPQLLAMDFKDHADAIWGQAADNGKLMTDRVNDGVALLREHTSTNERIGCLCFANPFSYALLRPSPTGGSPFFDYGYNFTDAFVPSAQRILGNADVVIYPKADEDAPTIATLLRICGPMLSKNFSFVAESGQWVLLRRQSE